MENTTIKKQELTMEEIFSEGVGKSWERETCVVLLLDEMTSEVNNMLLEVTNASCCCCSGDCKNSSGIESVVRKCHT